MVKNYNFEKYFDCILKILPINIIALAVMTLYRVFFFFYFADLSTLSGLYGYVFKAFLLGLRFDLSVLAYINSLVILIFTLFLLIRSLKAFNFAVFIIKIYYWAAFTFIIFLNLVDFGFYTYFGEHINLLFFDFFADDTAALIKTIIQDRRFLAAFVVLIAGSFIAYKLSSFTSKQLLDRHCIINTDFFVLPLKAVFVLFVLVIVFLFARGTVSMFPLGTFHTQISPNAFINKLSISSAHSLADALYAKSEQSSDKIDLADKLSISKDTIDLSVFNKTSILNEKAAEIKPNVVFIILESFGTLPIFYNSESFDILGELKQHFDEDTVFYNFLAAGRITIHCIESTVLNMPQRPLAMQVTQSPKAFNKYSSSMVLPFKKAGYISKAIYGGSLTWRGIESFYKAQGFDEIYGEGSIKNEHRHEWGINDAQFFEIVLRELKKNDKKPKLIYALSTATHPPYETPPYYEPLPIEIPAELQKMMPGEKKYGNKIFETYQFANREAAKFISAVKGSELAENTIIVLTGDHNLREIAALTPEDLFKKHAVPLYLYVPESLKQQFNTETAGSQMDIMPTLYDIALSEAEYVAAGTSLLDTEKTQIAFNSEGFILSGNNAVSFDINTGKALYFNFDTTTKMLTQTEGSPEHLAMIEYYKNTLAASDIYLNKKEQQEK